MSETLLLVFVLIGFQSIVLSQTTLGSCDYQRFKANGCEDELGADCEATTNQCRCKSGNWVVVDKRFCFPTTCPEDEYYDHNYAKCLTKIKADYNDLDNYCKHDFQCKGDNVFCKSYDAVSRCHCNQGFIYDSATQSCHRFRGIGGYCERDGDCCYSGGVRNFVCNNNSCQCKPDFTYNSDIDGCEDNEVIKSRGSQMKKAIILFIILGLFFGVVLSLKFGTTSVASTERLLLMRIIEQRRRDKELERQRKLDEEDQQLPQQEEVVIELDSNDKTENLINKRETA